MTIVKTISTTLVAAIAAASLSTPAKAELTGGELATLLLGGAVIYKLSKDRKDDRRRAAIEAEQNNATGYLHRHDNLGRHFHKHGSNHAHDHGYKTQPVVHDLPLPQQCKRQVTVGNKIKDAYRARCLERAGYDIAKNGTVRHDRWSGRKARPILIYR